MNKLTTLIICLFALFANIQAAETAETQSRATDAHIFGHVVDITTGEHLPFATIRLQGTAIGMATDATGHYFFRNLPEGNFTLEVSMLGFESQIRDVTIVAGNTEEHNFYLHENGTALDEIVVSADRNETIRRLAPSLVSVIGRQTLDVTSAQTLADGLRFTPGIRVESTCGNCGFTQVRMLGLSGEYTQILIDSRPVVGALGGMLILEQIPANMIERIEVVRGGGSALFGANAVGGVINVITREPLRNQGEFAHTINSFGENTTNFNISLVNDTRTAGIAAYGHHRQRDGIDINGDGFTNLAELEGRAFGFRSFLRTGLHSRLTLDYHNRHEFRRGGDNLDLQPYEAYIAEQFEHLVNGASLRFDRFANPRSRFSLYSAFQHVRRNGYYGAGDPFRSDIPAIFPGMTQAEIDYINAILENNEERINSFSRSTELTYQIGGQYNHSFEHLWFMPAYLTAGLEYSGSRLTDISQFRSLMDISQDVRIASAFLQNEWRSDRWSFLVGGRADNHNLIDGAIFSPRATIRHNPLENISFRLTYSEGFRAPQITEDILHASIAGGQRIIFRMADDLREERSRSVNLSGDFTHRVGNVRFNALAEGFYTRLSNPFTETRIGNYLVIENDDEGAAVYGINLEGRLAYRTFSLQAGVTFQHALFDETQSWIEDQDLEDYEHNVEPTRRMLRTPNTYAYFVASWQPIRNFTTSLSGNFTGSMLVPHEAGFGRPGYNDRYSKIYTTFTTPTFFEMNVRFAYDFVLQADTRLQLNAGINNIFDSFQRNLDTGPGKDADFVFGTIMPRTFFAGVRLMF
jgi:outer membrane receptor for ferrienterochelin and colicins